MTNTENTSPAMPHNPEPWWLDDYGFIASGSGDTYCTVADPHCRPTADYGDENEANGHRIVAAVNACKGISTEALHQGVIAEMIEVLQQVARILRTDSMNYGDNKNILLTNCRNAISRATGRVA